MATSARDKEAPRRPEVFISYSRKDREFVKRLEAALQARGREAWVDWEGIRPAERFMQAIYPAIEGTDTFAFVISPDSVTSTVCRQELDHAAAHNKRMVPIFAREVDAKTVPEPLAELNWVFFCRENEDFDVGTETLISALDTDLDWVHAHTRLLTRAIEWQAKGKSNSFVLRGEDLSAAEKWLAQAGSDKERQPTALQTEYIIASRKASSKRQRITLGAVAFGAMVAIVLAILAWLQRDKALASLSQSYFAEGARLTKADQPGRALPYFARAVRLTGHPASATRIVSLLTQRAWPVPRALRKQSDATQAFYSLDGRKAVAALPDGSIVLRDGETSRPIAVLARGRDIIGACFSPDGAVLVTLISTTDKESAAAQFWNAQTGAPTGESEVVPGEYKDPYTGATKLVGGVDERGIPNETLIIFSADGSRVVVHLQGKSAVWDARKARKLFDLPECWGHESFSTDGESLAAISFSEGGVKKVDVWETATGRKRRSWPVPATMDLVSWSLSPDGSRVALSSKSSAFIYEVASGKVAMPLATAAHDVWSVEFNATGRLFLLTGPGGASVCDAATGKPLGPLLRHPSGTDLRSASFSPEGGRVLTLSKDGTMRIWDAATMLPLIAFDYSDAESASWSVDGTAVVIARSRGTQQSSWSVSAGAASPRLLPGREHGNHGFLSVTVEDESEESGTPGTADSPSRPEPVGHAYVWDLSSGKQLMKAAVTLIGGRNLASFSTNGGRVALPSTSGLRTWDISTGREINAGSADFLLSPDQTRVLRTSAYEMPALAELEGNKPARELRVDKTNGEVCSECFSHDGRLIATSCPNGSIQIWDAASAKQIVRFTVPAGSDKPRLAFSPDDRRLFTRVTDVREWDLRKGNAIGNPITGEWKGWSFNASGSRIAVVTDESLSVLDTGTGAPVWPPLLLKDQPKHRISAEVPAFSPNGRLLATYARYANSAGCQLWDAETGTPLLDPIRPPPGWLFTEMEFSADSTRLVLGGSAEGKGFALIVDTSTGEELWREEFAAKDVTSNHFLPDGCQLIVGSNQTRVWDMAPPGKAPAFLADAAEAASGLRLTDTGALEPLANPAAEWERVRAQFAGLAAANRWAQIGRWFFAESSQRPRSPYAVFDEPKAADSAPLSSPVQAESPAR